VKGQEVGIVIVVGAALAISHTGAPGGGPGLTHRSLQATDVNACGPVVFG
jgi:hypothetical protein